MFRQLQQIDIAGQKSFHHAVSRKPLHIPRPDVEQHAQRIAAHALRRGRKFPAQPLFQAGTAEETGGVASLGHNRICALPPIHPRPQSHFQHPVILPVQNLPRQYFTSPDHRLHLQGWPSQCAGQPCLQHLVSHSPQPPSRICAAPAAQVRISESPARPRISKQGA